jgi:putative ABC transport system substrate-binding protein
MTKDAQAAAHTLGLHLHVLHASTEHEIDKAFETMARLRAGALLIGADALFTSGSKQLAELAVRHAIPAIYSWRNFVAAGGLMVYGPTVADIYRPLGVYAGRILKGEKPTDLPVMQPTRFELVINLKTARTLGLDVPPKLLALADEVIE